MYRILILTVVLIVYGSLYPWDFHSRQVSASPLLVLIASWPARLSVNLLRDAILNVLLYIPLGAAAFLALARKWGVAIGIAGALLIGFALSMSVEIAQQFDRQRVSSLLDVMTNTAGSSIGAIAAWILFPQWKSANFSRHVAWKREPAAFALLLIWVSFQLYPLVPSYGFTRLPGKLLALVQSPWSGLELLACITEGLVVAIICERVFGVATSRLLFICIPLALPVRLMIAGRTLAATDLIGIAAAFAIWALFLHRTPYRLRVCAGIVIIILVVRGVAPFYLSRTPSLFHWKPFTVSMGNDWTSSALVLLRKLFDYGSALWVAHIAGTSYLFATSLVAVTLAFIEAVQVWLPGRAAESTDPVIAIMLGFILWRLEKERQVANVSHAKDRKFVAKDR
jgi:VanZ family protein